MAEIEKTPVKVTYTLTLDEEEAKVIRALTGNVAGEGSFYEASRRIFNALVDAAVPRIRWGEKSLPYYYAENMEV